ncbi:MFS transporter [Planomonospora sp. ID91781]|uniref:MFS transporter n=1 Tax=Planomonospora sp. ID91781 TaxID=2738135 RepID=UPI001E53C8B9|nr:MFS transporter [Planomonospora sp. ID91781]
MTASPLLRITRAAAFAAVCIGLSTAAHLLAGGAICAQSAAGGLVLAFTAGLAAAGRERPLAVILPLLAGVQVALHVLFSLTHASLTHASLTHAAPAAEVAGITGHAHTGLAPSLGMLIAHGWAVALTALWLARGEAALWALLRRLPLRLRRLLRVFRLPDPVPFLTATSAEPVAPRRTTLLRHAVHRRGPPRQVTAALR